MGKYVVEIREVGSDGDNIGYAIYNGVNGRLYRPFYNDSRVIIDYEEDTVIIEVLMLEYLGKYCNNAIIGKKYTEFKEWVQEKARKKYAKQIEAVRKKGYYDEYDTELDFNSWGSLTRDVFEQVIDKDLEKLPDEQRKREDVKDWVFSEFILLWGMAEFFLISYDEWHELDTKNNDVFNRTYC